eukprot:COSAG04_NODE_1510_length_6492_cov_11.980291_4_plen_196_part_00
MRAWGASYICILSMVAGGAIQQVGVWATSPFEYDCCSGRYRRDVETALVVGGAALLLAGALGFGLGLDHEVGGDRGHWDSLKDVVTDVLTDAESTYQAVKSLCFCMLLFPLAWCLWVLLIFADDGGGDGHRLCDGRGGNVMFFLWAVLSSLAATAWICLWDWAPTVPALVSAAALVTVLFEAIKEAAVLMKGERR